MSSLKTSPEKRLLSPDWLPHTHVLPLILSVVAHATLLLLFAFTVRSCHHDPVGFSDEPTLEVGIFVERGDRPDTQVAGEPNEVTASDTAVEMARTDQFTPTQVTPETPPAETILPKADLPATIGIGRNVPAGPSIADPRDSVKSQGGSRAPATGNRGGIPGAAFMGAEDKGGMKVVFVIDASGSMTSYNAMKEAKGALLASVQALDERQQFLMIFYDDKPRVIKLHNESNPTLVAATDLNKTLARQSVAGIQPGSGTDHLPPLKLALAMNPDVIFFLTDALDPPLWPQDLEKIRKMNGGRVRIHSIEFGQGPELEAQSDLGNFLRKLAFQNGGTYRYHDVTRFKNLQDGRN